MNRLPANICDNLHFLVVEVTGQLDELKRFLKSGSVARGQRVLDRKGYSENLMLRIQNACVQGIAGSGDRRIPRLRATQNIAADLGRITELARDAINQTTHMQGEWVILAKIHLSMLDSVSEGVKLVEEALEENDTRLALKLGELERQVDREYKILLKKYTRALRDKGRTEDLIAALLMAHTLECMGNLLLDISEALLSSILGQPMGLDRYQSLMESLQRLAKNGGHGELDVEPIAETRSGSGISGISNKRKRKKKAPGYLAIYKDGLQHKVKEERDGVANWHDIYPGLAPRILSYKKQGNSASLLIEHLSGMTFEQILIEESEELLGQTLRQLGKTLNDVWRETKSKKSASAGFMKQLNKRLGDVYAVHPEFDSSPSRVCGFEVASFEQLVKKAEKVEQKLKPPFSVYIHGDFNVDNVIYDPREKKISYVDLHRSCYMDYVQDVSVFMVSSYRLQIIDTPIRKRIIHVIRDFYRIAARYARRNEDTTFELRLALGLVRSFVTSTRFILDQSLAGDMYLRARYLLEQVTSLDRRAYTCYKVPVQELFVG